MLSSAGGCQFYIHASLALSLTYLRIWALLSVSCSADREGSNDDFCELGGDPGLP